MADNVVETIFVKLGLDASGYNKDAEKAIKQNDKLSKSTEGSERNIMALGKTIGKVFGVAASLVGLKSLIDEVQKLNDELFFLEKNLGMSAKSIKAWQGAAGAMGGSADGMTESMKSLNMSMNDFVTMGDTSMLPYMNALGVSMVDTNGKIRDTDKVMLDLADSFSKMDREQAFSLASKMGIDEGTFNTLVQGRQEMEKMIEYQKTMYQSSEAELQVSRELSKNRALLGQQWQSLKTMLANTLMPIFLKASEILLGMFEYLQKHQRTAQIIIKSIAFMIGAVLIPVMTKAAISATAMLLPFAPLIATVTALGAAFGLLYDDYKTWAEGGKSLFDWGAFKGYIDKSKLSTDNLANAFKNLGKELMSSAIPSLRGYAEIIQKLMSGDFKGAAKQAWDMTKNYYGKAADFVDDLTGNKQGTLASNAKQFVSGGSNAAPAAKQKYSSKAFTPEKAASIARVAKNIGVNPDDLAAVISFETGGTFSPNARNKGSSATGLIQFMGKGATKRGGYNNGKYYGMSRDQFGALSFDEQMNFVEKYFKERSSRFRAGNEGKNTTGDVYGAVTGYGYKRGSEAYRLNQVWDSNKNGIIEKGEMVQNPSFRAHQRNYFDGATMAQESMRQGQGGVPMRNVTGATNGAKVDVTVGNVTVNSNSSTVAGTASDAMAAVKNQIGQWFPAIQ